jgi:hypothetical protein
VVNSVTAQRHTFCSAARRQFDPGPVGNRQRRRRSGRGCAKNGPAPSAPPEPVEPYAVLTLTCNGGQFRAMRSSPPPLGRIASGGCWRGDAVMREARSHRAVRRNWPHEPRFHPLRRFEAAPPFEPRLRAYLLTTGRPFLPRLRRGPRF